MCSRCKEEKQTSEFNKKAEGFRPECRECSREASREGDRKATERNKKNILEMIGEYRCMECHIGHDNPSFFEWHHRIPREVAVGYKIADIIHHSWEKVRTELQFCVLLCPNCHKEKHI